jgi:hypothetical protein
MKLHEIVYNIYRSVIPFDLDEEGLAGILSNTSANQGFLVARSGSVEAKSILYSRFKMLRPPLKLVMGYNDNRFVHLKRNAGFWDNSKEGVIKFGLLYHECIKSVDVLGSWRIEERLFTYKAKSIKLNSLDPFFATEPWTLALKKKKILVVHPFITSFKNQYKKGLNNVHARPYFHEDVEIIFYRPCQGIGYRGEESWFDILDNMNKDIAKMEFDVALIAAGAFGLPLAAEIKRSGRVAIHMGGSLQILFGVKGRRWESDTRFDNIITKHFIRPIPTETPKGAAEVENSCYW